MQIHAPETVAREKLTTTAVLVNIFNGSERSQVSLQLDGQGPWLSMRHVRSEDPAFQAAYKRDVQLKENQWIDLPKPGISTHIWGAPLPATLEPGFHLLCVKTVDMHGRTFASRRIIRVVVQDTED